MDKEIFCTLNGVLNFQDPDGISSHKKCLRLFSLKLSFFSFYFAVIMKFLCIFLITLCSFGEANLQYCNKCRYHTMCGTVKSGPRCFNHKSIPPNKKQIKEILHFHNSIRNRVANGWEKRGKPGPLYSAANMMKMVCFWCSVSINSLSVL